MQELFVAPRLIPPHLLQRNTPNPPPRQLGGTNTRATPRNHRTLPFKINDLDNIHAPRIAQSTERKHNRAQYLFRTISIFPHSLFPALPDIVSRVENPLFSGGFSIFRLTHGGADRPIMGARLPRKVVAGTPTPEGPRPPSCPVHRPSLPPHLLHRIEPSRIFRAHIDRRGTK